MTEQEFKCVQAAFHEEPVVVYTGSFVEDNIRELTCISEGGVDGDVFIFDDGTTVKVKDAEFTDFKVLTSLQI